MKSSLATSRMNWGSSKVALLAGQFELSSFRVYQCCPTGQYRQPKDT